MSEDLALLSLEMLMLDDAAAQALAAGEPSSVGHVRITGDRAVDLEGPGLPALRRCDVGTLRKSWLTKRWFSRLEAVGCTMLDDWLALRNAGLSGAIVLCQGQHQLHRQCSHENGAHWDLWAERAAKGWSVEARPVEGSTCASLLDTLAQVASLRCTSLRVPENYLGEVKSLVARQKTKVSLEATLPCWPERLGLSLEGASAFVSQRRTPAKARRA